MNFKEIKELIEILDQSSLTEINIEDKGNIVNLNKEKDNLKTINAPMVGTFYKSPSPEESPYVQIGDSVSNESTVCILEAMKLFNEIQAEVTGEITEILVEDGQMVEYGQPLFKVK